MVFNKNGIFSKAEQGTTKYGKEKSRDALELALGEVKIMKYEERPDEETYNQKLDEQLNKIGQIEGDNKDEVTVEGHRWKIDRVEPKILDYLGEADGIEITYTITGNDTWTKAAKTITANVTVKNNKGALDTSSIIIKKKVGNGSETDITRSVTINSNGTFALTTTEVEETVFTVSAKNSAGKQSTPKTIKIVPKIDTTPPTLSNPTATAEKMKIKISVNAEDTESEVKQIKYSVNPTTVKKSDGTAITTTETITSGQVIELTATEEREYTVTFTAEDNAGNTTPTGVTAKATTIDGITVAEAKKITAATYPDYLGKKVIDYSPTAGGTWRVFYYDASGEFGDGAGTIYLKMNNVKTSLSSYTGYVPTDGGALMKQLNPAWRDSANGKKATTNWLPNEHCVSWLCDSTKWTQYKTNEAKYAIGSAPIEMWCKAHNIYRNKYDKVAALIGCGIKDANGYGYKINNGSLVGTQNVTVVSDTNTDASKVFVSYGTTLPLASPWTGYNNYVGAVNSGQAILATVSGVGTTTPVVSLKH